MVRVVLSSCHSRGGWYNGDKIMSTDWKDFGCRVAVVALFVLLILFGRVVSARTDESVSVLDTFACPSTELMDQFATNGVTPQHKVCSLLSWDASVGKSTLLRLLKVKGVGSLPGKQSRYAARPALYAVEVQGRKLYAIRNPAFIGSLAAIVTTNLIPDYPYKSWMFTYWVAIV